MISVTKKYGISMKVLPEFCYIGDHYFKHMLSNDLQHYSALLDIHIDTLIWLLIAPCRSTSTGSQLFDTDLDRLMTHQ